MNATYWMCDRNTFDSLQSFRRIFFYRRQGRASTDAESKPGLQFPRVYIFVSYRLLNNRKSAQLNKNRTNVILNFHVNIYFNWINISTKINNSLIDDIDLHTVIRVSQSKLFSQVQITLINIMAHLSNESLVNMYACRILLSWHIYICRGAALPVWVAQVLEDDHYKRMSRCSMVMNTEQRVNVLSPSPAMVTSPYEWKIVDWDKKPQQTNTIFEFYLPLLANDEDINVFYKARLFFSSQNPHCKRYMKYIK